MSRRETIHKSINLAFRPRDGTRTEFHRAREDSEAHKVKESASLVGDAVKDFGETEKAFFREGGFFLLDVHWICSCQE